MDEKTLHLEMYKIAIDGANKISERRGVMNGLFITIQGAILGFVGTNSNEPTLIPISCIFGILLSLIWFAKIIGYKELNGIKYDIICEIEKKFLPIKIYSDEYSKLKQKKVYSLTKYEAVLPIIFFTGYILIYLCLC